MDEVAKKRHVSLYILNLLWAVPLAIAIGYFPAAIVRFQRCGLHECLGEVKGFASPLALDAIGVAILGAVVLIPWLRSVRLRLLIALVVAALMFVFWVWVILFQ